MGKTVFLPKFSDMVIYLFNLPSEDLNIRTHLKTSFIVIGTLLSGICHIIWKILNNKLNTCFFHWDLGKVLTSFINLAYRALSQTYNMPENMSWFSFICLHLQWFGRVFLQKPFSTSSLLRTHSWMKTHKFAHLPTLVCSFYWVICNRPHSSKEWEARSSLLSKTPVH